MVDRDAYVKKMQAKLDDWNAEIDQLSAKADAAQADAKLEYDKQVETLKNSAKKLFRGQCHGNADSSAVHRRLA